MKHPTISRCQLCLRTGAISLILLLGGMSQVQAKWQLTAKNLLRPTSNVRVFLSMEEASPTPAARTYLARMDFRLTGQSAVFLHKEVRFQHQAGTPYYLDIKLPPGKYEIEADIEDRALEDYNSAKLDEPLMVSRDGELYLSDIFLTPDRSDTSVFLVPQMVQTIPHAQANLAYAMEVSAPGYSRLSLRAVLYEEKTLQVGASTRAYESRQQTNQVLQLDDFGRGVFRHTLDLQSLTWGEYMIQILVYQDEEFVMDKKTWFIKGGDTEVQVFAELNASIRMMRYILPESELQGLLEVDELPIKTLRFRETWRKLYGEDAKAQMEAYYQKVYQANARFIGEEVEGWLTDRGRVFITYGPPIAKAVEIQGKPYLRWTYPKWALSFLFEKRNQAYLLVE